MEMDKWYHVAVVMRFYRVPPEPSTCDVYVNAKLAYQFGPEGYGTAEDSFGRPSFVGNVSLDLMGRLSLWVAAPCGRFYYAREEFQWVPLYPVMFDWLISSVCVQAD